MSAPHTTVPVSDVVPRAPALARWEKTKNRRVSWLVECVAEATGTFLYTFAGAGSTASFVLGNILKIDGLGSLLQVGLAYSIGIALALAICVTTSGGHFNPGFTVHAVVFQGFPIRKALRQVTEYIDIFGAYIACLLVYVQYKQLIHTAVDALKGAGLYESLMFTPNGPGGIFGLYVNPGSNLGYVVLNEFVCDFIIGICVFGVLDPSNHLASPTTLPWLIGLAYGVVIWGFSPVGVAANAARDLGGRFAALTLFGTAASGGKYAALAALTNIPAILLAGLFYEVVFADSTRGACLA
ncbi:aquaporin-like protein [Dichomitus squalens]|uniref:Aquaporin-like protein n=1 Tax=Dichomitus squalens TaxID=114155 RepID=A0A4Q9MUX1_9APHY|nr:aquaporin-like protein [Dichomitus squalens]